MALIIFGPSVTQSLVGSFASTHLFKKKQTQTLLLDSHFQTQGLFHPCQGEC